MIAEIAQHEEELVELCQRYRVSRLELFGSAATGDFHADTSDLDFIALFANADQPGYARRYLEFAESLESLFRRHVDLLTERSISNPFFRKSVDHSRITIYEDHVSKVVA
jgi:uncharacterized protein